MTGIKRRISSLLGPQGTPGPPGEPGERGLPGPNAIPADEAVASYIQSAETNTRKEIDTAISHTAYPVDAGAVVDLWEPPTQAAGPELNAWSAADIYAMWDDIVALDTNYGARSSIGNGTDGLPIYAYTFAPPAYGNTIVLSGMHGAEKIGMYTVAQFIRLLVTDWQQHPALAELRAQTRIVVVPIASRHAADNNNRTNANGVDLNRNWSYFWDDFDSSPGDPTYKGPSAFSEPETRAIRDLVLDLESQGGLVAALDIHDTGAEQKPNGYHFYVVPPSNELPGGGNWIRGLVDDIIEHQNITDPNIQMLRTDTPTARNWYASRGLWTATIEYEMRWGQTSMDATNMTAALRWIGNAIIRAVKQGAAPALTQEPFVKRFAFNAGQTQIDVPIGTNQELVEFSWEFAPPCAGIIEFYGHLIIGGAQPDRVYVTPAAGKSDTSRAADSPSSAYDTLYQWHNGNHSQGATIFPFSIATAVTENPRHLAKVSIFAYTSEHPAIVYRYRGTLKFTPAEGPGRFEQYAATHRSGPGAMQLIRGV